MYVILVAADSLTENVRECAQGGALPCRFDECWIHLRQIFSSMVSRVFEVVVSGRLSSNGEGATRDKEYWYLRVILR